MPKSWTIEGQVEQERELEEYFMEGLCAYYSLGIFLIPLSSACPLSLVPHSRWNDAHLFTLSHLCHSSLICSLSCLSLPQTHNPPSLPSSLDDFKWPQGKLFGVQVEFICRPGSLLTWNFPLVSLDMGSASELEAPRMAIIIQSPVPWTFRLIKWAAVSTFDPGLTCV